MPPLATPQPPPQPAAEPEPRPAKKTDTSTSPLATPAELAAIAKGNRAFAVSLYRQLAARPGNVFVSPISIAGAFGPVTAGAQGQTRAEIGKVLRFPADEEALHRSLGSLLKTLESDADGARVSIANALWLKQDFEVKPGFVDLARRRYDANVETLDFRNSPAAAARINGWVDRETNRRIPKLFEPDAFADDTAVVVTNAVAFLGNWRQPFDPRQTRPRPFYLADGTTREVPMMSAGHMDARCVCWEPGGRPTRAADAVQLLELPYKGDRLSMVVILPNARKGLRAVEAQLSAAKLDEWLRLIDASWPEDISVLLPRVEIESSYDLEKPLKALGMNVPFVPRRADFTGISPLGRRLYINDAVHKTFLRIDEKGTEAAVTTGVVISIERGGLSFIADHPFLVLIRDRQTGAILFLGRIAEP